MFLDASSSWQVPGKLNVHILNDAADALSI